MGVVCKRHACIPVDFVFQTDMSGGFKWYEFDLSDYFGEQLSYLPDNEGVYEIGLTYSSLYLWRWIAN